MAQTHCLRFFVTSNCASLGGKIYTLPLVDSPGAADLQTFHHFCAFLCVKA